MAKTVISCTVCGGGSLENPCSCVGGIHPDANDRTLKIGADICLNVDTHADKFDKNYRAFLAAKSAFEHYGFDVVDSEEQG